MSTNLLAANRVQHTLAVILFSVTLSIAIRVFVIQARIDSSRVLILGIAMSVIAPADVTSCNVTGLALHTDCFLPRARKQGFSLLRSAWYAAPASIFTS